MAPYPTPPDEAERLALLHALNLLDTPAEPVFDRITRLVAQILNVPIALVSLVGASLEGVNVTIAGVTSIGFHTVPMICRTTVDCPGSLHVTDADFATDPPNPVELN